MLEPHCFPLPCAGRQILCEAVLHLEREKAPRTGMPTWLSPLCIGCKASELRFLYALFVAISVGAQHSAGGGVTQ